MNTQPHVLQPASVLADFVSLRFLPSLFGHDYAQAENNVYLYAMAANAGVRFAFRDWTIFAARYPESSQASHRGLGVYRKQGADAYMAFHNGIYRTGHNEGKLTAEDIEKVAAAAGAGAASDEDKAVSDHVTENNAVLAEMMGLRGTPGIIVMPAGNATPDNTTVIPGVVSEQVMQQAIARAEKG
jgi:protein-disulfide isomerase